MGTRLSFPPTNTLNKKRASIAALLLTTACMTGCFEGIDAEAADEASSGAETGESQDANLDTEAAGLGDDIAAFTLPPEDDEIVQYLRQNNDITVDEARRRVRLQHQAPLVLARAEAEFGDDLAGSWLDADGTLKVAFVADDAEARGVALRANYPESWRIQGVTAKYSLRQLGEVQEDIRAFADADETLRDAVRSTRIDTESNRIIVGIAPSELSRVEGALAAEFGDTVTFEAQDVVPSSSACTRTNCGAPLRGGVKIQGPGGCSSGFTAQSADGTKWLLTAGHCGALNTQWWHGSHYIGPIRQTVYAGAVDAARIRVDNGYWQSSWMGGLVLSHSGDLAAKVITVLGAGQIPKGMIICKAGAVTHRTCGPVYSTTWAGYYSDGSYHHHMLHSGACSNPGDSGGAVYFDGSAFDGKVKGIGIMSAAGGFCGQSGASSFSSMLEHIYKVMPVRAVTRL